ncbi:MAG: DUF6624 domain-containing protein [Bacteroidota bacterium]|uniref:Lipoprotein n=1 Tax=Flagellimonas okinawensis TaxID=3031324 RepID=A0ABT5XKP5_9FLAO|nr:DUF6624 domain-containing protein [[Muricauda] okinawensis]MDF0706458.1 hypothetical protein [[Muricauda] okinawensis]MEC8831225.1 DUF6624 domain-containing protein [Bacteroidota bacterium]
MKIHYYALFFCLLIASCKGKSSAEIEKEEKVVFDQSLADELERMAEVDQIAAYIPQGKYTEMSQEEWKSFKDSVFTTHQKRLTQIFDKHGFVGFDLAGENGSNNFWLMVQHSDHAPDFQKKVLQQMKIAVDHNNASPSNYGLLVDRVNLNTGLPQVYGTQVDYRFDVCQAFPKNLKDSANVNQRRSEIGLPPLEEYLNRMSKMHFEINKKIFLDKGIKGPKLYEIDDQ